MKGVLAAVSPDNLWKGMDWWNDLAPSQHELVIVLAATGVVGVLAILWAVFIRKRERNGSERYIYTAVRRTRNGGSDAAESQQPGKKRRRRRKRRRNPTLAETGGLPPIRSESFPGDPP
jgi:hypothetical protein